MKYSNDIQGTIKLQKFYFRIKLTEFLVRKLSPVGLYMPAHALTVVKWVCSVLEVSMMAQSVLIQDDGHIAAGTTVSSLGILAAQHTDIIQLRVCNLCADKKQLQNSGSVRMYIQ